MLGEENLHVNRPGDAAGADFPQKEWNFILGGRWTDGGALSVPAPFDFEFFHQLRYLMVAFEEALSGTAIHRRKTH